MRDGLVARLPVTGPTAGEGLAAELGHLCCLDRCAELGAVAHPVPRWYRDGEGLVLEWLGDEVVE